MEDLPFFFPTVCTPLAPVFALVPLHCVSASNSLLAQLPIANELGCIAVDLRARGLVELPA